MKCPHCGRVIRADDDAPGLFSHKAPRTSKRAALRVNTGTQRADVLMAFLKHSRLADYIGEVVTGLRHQSYTPRRLELEELGFVVEDGETDRPDGSRHTVYRITPSGVTEAARLNGTDDRNDTR